MLFTFNWRIFIVNLLFVHFLLYVFIVELLCLFPNVCALVSFKILEVSFSQLVGELLLLNIANGINVLEFSLSVPILVEQVIIAS